MGSPRLCVPDNMVNDSPQTAGGGDLLDSPRADFAAFSSSSALVICLCHASASSQIPIGGEFNRPMIPHF
jgi:hypothetical protein